ncbi:hypothetical protein NM208_g7156 [Fusarium decemcellulare]|uniref:Uncharacterized protein n=1 Tax=Fusarium decemcellulare TaxID=57161 RepID=A0ACC1SAG7_9HYPO|nr:hypothetical protein NM208_g7156 [Fusarium decemcellulare]
MAAPSDDAKSLRSPWFGYIRPLIFDHNNIVWVHQTRIDEHPEFASKFTGGELRMPDVPYKAAHVLVNYLYTDKYETLRSSFDSDLEKAKYEFNVASHTYCLARKYGLPRLESLALDELKVLSYMLPLESIIGMLEEREFDRVQITGSLRDYLVRSVRELGRRKAIQMGNGVTMRTRAMSTILLETIREMNGENEKLKERVEMK